jgi:rubrerythrin
VNEEIRSALSFAIDKEHEAEAFYKEWASRVKSAAVKAMLAELAATEHGHAEMLSRVTPEDLIGGSAPAVSDLKLSELMTDVEASAEMGVQEAMILAMKREEEAAALYDELARLGGEAQSLFEALAKEERKHKLQLETEYDEAILTDN